MDVFAHVAVSIFGAIARKSMGTIFGARTLVAEHSTKGRVAKESILDQIVSVWVCAISRSFRDGKAIAGRCHRIDFNIVLMVGNVITLSFGHSCSMNTFKGMNFFSQIEIFNFDQAETKSHDIEVWLQGQLDSAVVPLN